MKFTYTMTQNFYICCYTFMPLYSMWNRKHVCNRAFQMANNKACGGGTTKRPASYSFRIDPTENVEHLDEWNGTNSCYSN